jgi:MSHA biogenesis protein MshL
MNPIRHRTALRAMATALTPMLALSLNLAGCQSAPSNATYDAIRKEVAVDPARRSDAPKVDAAVADALLPPAASLATQLPKARPALEERFNVSFNNVPAQQFFRSIVAGTRYNVLVHPDVAGAITVSLKDVTLQETLDAVREMYGYDYRIEGTRISIKPLTMQTRMFRVNYLTGNRRGVSNLRVNSTSVANAINNQNGNSQTNGSQNNTQNGQNGQNNGQVQGQVESTDVSTTTGNDFWTDLKSAVEAIVGSKDGGRSVVVSPQSGVLVIRAMPDELRSVDAYLRATQLAVDRQVILEAKIIEVELNDTFQSGVNWASFTSIGGGHPIGAGMLAPGANLRPLAGGQATALADPTAGLVGVAGSSLATATTAAGSLLGLAFQTKNFAALMSFLETQGTVHVLSSPRIAAVNNQKAVLKIGTDEFFVTGVTSTTNLSAAGNTTTPSVTLQSFFSGVVLDVTPQIDDKGNILLHVHPSVSQVSTVNKAVNLGSAGNLNLPLAASATSELDSIVRGQNGQVVAIGGLMRQSSTADDDNLPGTRSLPGLNALLGSKKRVNQKRELVVLIKPTIVEGGSNWNDDLLDAGRRIEQMAPRGMR